MRYLGSEIACERYLFQRAQILSPKHNDYQHAAKTLVHFLTECCSVSQSRDSKPTSCLLLRTIDLVDHAPTPSPCIVSEPNEESGSSARRREQHIDLQKSPYGGYPMSTFGILQNPDFQSRFLYFYKMA
jgi:hypothetical protein